MWTQVVAWQPEDQAIEVRFHHSLSGRPIRKENGMNKDRVEGKVKDLAGRIERQAGEWTGDTKKEAAGAAKQVEGKVQSAWGNLKDDAKKVAGDAQTSSKPPQRAQGSKDSDEEPAEGRRSHR
jgi:uncharacterized protein YjbJ (UPF0337 family)